MIRGETMKYDKVPAGLEKKLVLGACVVLSDFDPATGAVDINNIIGATGGGVRFTAAPTIKNFFEGIDNIPDDVMEGLRVDRWSATLTGDFKSVDPQSVARYLAAADVSSESNGVTKITPRAQLKKEDFKTIWIVGNYSDVNDGDNAGSIAICMKNTLSLNGFQMNTAEDDKATFPVNYKTHYSLENPDEIPFDIYLASAS